MQLSVKVCPKALQLPITGLLREALILSQLSRVDSSPKGGVNSKVFAAIQLYTIMIILIMLVPILGHYIFL